MANCAIIPQVKNNKDQIVDSRLFKDLLAYTGNNREDTKRLYYITKNSEFTDKFGSRLKFDENNEPTLRSMLKETNISEVIPTSKVVDKLNKDIGAYKRGTKEFNLSEDTKENNDKLTQKAIEFNNNSEFSDDYVANVNRVTNKDSVNPVLELRVEKRNRKNSEQAERMEHNKVLNDKIIYILNQKGVAVGALTKLERKMGINGVTDFSIADRTADGLMELIRIANGVRGEQALPEEFAHFSIDALGNNVLVNRLLNSLNNEQVLKEVLGDEYAKYSLLYKDNQHKLVKEAAGKLVAEHLLRNKPVGKKSYSNLLDRVINAIKNFFSNIKTSEIQRAINSADKNAGNLADYVMSKEGLNDLNIKNIQSSELFYQTEERVDRDKRLLEEIRDNELKRLKIYGKRKVNEKFTEKQKTLIEQIEKSLESNEIIEGLYNYSSNALNELKSLKKRLDILKLDSESSLKDKAGLLRDIKNYIFSYGKITAEVKDALLEEETLQDNRYGQRLRVVLDNITILTTDLETVYKKTAMPLFIEFLKPFVGDSLRVPFGKNKGKETTLEDLVKTAERDISFFERWLDSMADSTDNILKLMFQPVLAHKEKARHRVIALTKELQAIHIKMEKAGIRNTEWMTELDSKGNKTFNYISEINQSLFKEKETELKKHLSDKYGEDPKGRKLAEMKQERREWYRKNTEIDDNGLTVPDSKIYKSKQFENLNPAQLEYYNKVMEIKKLLDSFIPPQVTTLLNRIVIRKDLLERIKSSESVTSGAKQFWEHLKDSLMKRGDDTDFGEKTPLIDFEGNRVQSLPIYYTHSKQNESANDLSDDVTSTMIAYAVMAVDYDEMNKVIDILEVGRDLLRQRKIAETEGSGKPLVEKFTELGKSVENKLFKKEGTSYFGQRLEDFFEMQVYGRYMKDEGTFGKTNIDKGKAANQLNRITAFNTLALNILSGVSNVATGSIMMRIESFSKEHFSEKDTIKADAIYASAMPEFLSEIGKRVRTSKLFLWNEYFNVLQEYEQDMKETNFDKKLWLERLGPSLVYFMNGAGEHWMQTRTSLALANRYKMKAPDGKIVSLWDAMEVVYTDPNDHSLGASLKLKEGYTKEDGSEFTEKDDLKFGRKTNVINERMHGIYNKLDMPAIKSVALGRMAMIFRNWIRPSFNRRFETVKYNHDMETWTEGYYRTSTRFLWQIAKDLKKAEFHILANYKELSTVEQANIMRSLTEVGHFLLILGALSIINWGGPDKNRPWLVKMMEYQLRRLQTEIGVMIPGKTMLDEGLRIIKSPSAVLMPIQTTLDLVGLMNPYNYETFNENAVIKSGQFKGLSKAERLVLKSPVAPMRNTITKGYNPDLAIPFFK